LGRFLQADPVVSAPEFSQGWNRYAYGFNNPMRFSDPTGFVSEDQARQSELTLDQFCLIHPNTCTDEQFQSPESMVEEFGEYGMGRSLGYADQTPENYAWALVAYKRSKGPDPEKVRGIGEQMDLFNKEFDKYLSAKEKGQKAAASAYLSSAAAIGNKAIGMAREAFGIKANGAKSFAFDASILSRGVTTEEKHVLIGAAAFSGSVARFAATIYHETLHARMIDKGLTDQEYRNAPAKYERLIYMMQLSPDNVRRFGLSAQDIGEIKREVNEYYGKIL
jgi:hypothetical protein